MRFMVGSLAQTVGQTTPCHNALSDWSHELLNSELRKTEPEGAVYNKFVGFGSTPEKTTVLSTTTPTNSHSRSYSAPSLEDWLNSNGEREPNQEPDDQNLQGNFDGNNDQPENLEGYYDDEGYFYYYEGEQGEQGSDIQYYYNEEKGTWEYEDPAGVVHTYDGQQGFEGQGFEGQGTEGQGTDGQGTEGQGTEGQGTEGQGIEYNDNASNWADTTTNPV